MTKRLVDTHSVVEQNVLGNGQMSVGAGLEMLPVNAFDLQGFEKGLGAGVVVRRTGTAHALERAVGRDFTPEIP